MTQPQGHLIYTGRSTNWPALWLSVMLALPLLVMAKGPEGSWTAAGLAVPIAVVVITIVFNLVTASSVRAIAGTHGVTVHFGVFGWPRFRYPVDRIARAEAIEIPPTWWAWGIYWSPRNGLMLTLRNGPALRLVLANGKKVTISTPDPVAAVRAIDAAKAGLGQSS